ncbi:MAG: hypothetical protein KF878_32550 [Planctomycetes bacterium]|nr:hypothetical protein [Planctomycetota bacterium]
MNDPCVCSLDDQELTERERWLAPFAAGAESAADLEDGFELRFGGTWGARLLELIERERACCTSLVFELRFEPDAGPITLRCRGDAAATGFLRARLAPTR